MDGISPNEGRVEIFYDGYWGTICDDEWHVTQADVICRTLNYSGALSAPHRATFGIGNGHIWLDDVKCHGNESSIEECEHGAWGVSDCRHEEDAGVVCKTNENPSYGNYRF